MASRGKKKTTMAKLNREAKLRDRKYEKAVRKEARRLAEPPASNHGIFALDPDADETGEDQRSPESSRSS